MIELYDSYQPGLKDGTYRITVTQTVAAPGASVGPATQHFSVEGPRFAIPAADIHAQFPPARATGRFGETLPHIVFTKRLLPWERTVPELDATVPWLALLVFAEGELLGDRGSGDFARATTAGQLLHDGSADLRVPKLSAEPKTPCRVITMSSSLFVSVVPTGAELQRLAHVRTVEPGPSATIATKDPGTYSVVVGNRFPAKGDAAHATSNIVHLVSLEGFGDLLGGPQPTPPAIGGKTQSQVALVSLASWTFSCLDDASQHFSGLATNLARDPRGGPRSADSLLLKLPLAEPAPGASDVRSRAQRRLAEGHVALPYHTRTGEDAFAWYRGPFAPVAPATVIKSAPFATSDAAAAFDAETGLFDHSLAAAWQLGRGLALADEAFATTLMRLRLRANAGLESVTVGVTGEARLAALFEANVLGRVARASANGGLDPPPAASGRAVSAAPAAAVREALATTGVTLDPADPDVVEVVGWLARAQLLYPVPFSYLVPDARVLGPETIRFFYLDPNWIGALLDGAMSVGLATRRDVAVQQQLTAQLQALGAAAALGYRAHRLGQPAPAAATGATAGLLIRSALASGWPGLTVTATASDADVALLRLDHLAPTVLLCLFNGVPDTVTLAEPHEGLEFGVDDRGDISLRTHERDAGGGVNGTTIADAGSLAVYPSDPTLQTLRRPGGRTLNIAGGPAGSDLIGAIASRLGVDRSTIGSAELALQMLNGPEQVTFSRTGGE